MVQAIADRDGKELSSREIWEAFKAEYLDEAGRYRLRRPTSLPDRATGPRRSRPRSGSTASRGGSRGMAPARSMPSSMRWRERLAIEIEVVDYHEHAVGTGANATAVAYVEARAGDGRTLFGVGMDKNIVTASLRAVTSAANRLQRVK